VIFLSADAFGVLPPVSILTPEQTKYYFLSGYLVGCSDRKAAPKQAEKGGVGSVITRPLPARIAGRHQKSGSKTVLELHGSVHRNRGAPPPLTPSRAAEKYRAPGTFENLFQFQNVFLTDLVHFITCICSIIFSDAFGNKTVQSVRRVAFRNDQKDHEQNDEKRRAEGQVHFMAEIAARP